MGRYEEILRARIVERIIRKRYKFPAGFKGTVLWCPLCTKEIVRIPEGQALSGAEQQIAVDAHNARCGRRRLKLVEQPSGE